MPFQIDVGEAWGWAQVDLGAVKCALVVCDTQWRNCSSAEESGEEHLAAADYLRLDSMVSRQCSLSALWGAPIGSHRSCFCECL